MLLGCWAAFLLVFLVEAIEGAASNSAKKSQKFRILQKCLLQVMHFERKTEPMLPTPVDVYRH